MQHFANLKQRRKRYVLYSAIDLKSPRRRYPQSHSPERPYREQMYHEFLDLPPYLESTGHTSPNFYHNFFLFSTILRVKTESNSLSIVRDSCLKAEGNILTLISSSASSAFEYLANSVNERAMFWSKHTAYPICCFPSFSVKTHILFHVILVLIGQSLRHCDSE